MLFSSSTKFTAARLAATNQRCDLDVGHSVITLDMIIVSINHSIISYLLLEFQLYENGFTIYLVGKTVYGSLLMTQTLAIKLVLMSIAILIAKSKRFGSSSSSL